MHLSGLLLILTTILVKCNKTVVFFFPGTLHPCHSGSEAGCLHHCRGSDNHPQPQAAGLRSSYEVSITLLYKMKENWLTIEPLRNMKV